MTENARLRGASSPKGQRELNSSEYSNEQMRYFDDCQEKLLNNDVVGDGIISQREFTTAYSTLCFEYSNEGDCSPRVFQSLPTSVQFRFYETVCEAMQDAEGCVDNLNSVPMDIGYPVTSNNIAAVQTHMEGICLKMIDDVFFPPQSNSPTGDSPREGSLGSGSLNRPSNEGISKYDENLDETNDEPIIPELVPPTVDEQVDLANVGQEPISPSGSSAGNKVAVENNHSSSNGPMIGIAAVASACIFLAIFVLFRRRNHVARDKKRNASEQHESVECTDYESGASDSGALVLKDETSTLSKFEISRSLSSDQPITKEASKEDIELAIDIGNWDAVYKLASEMAGKEDIDTVFTAHESHEGLSPARVSRRMNLHEEEHERARALDDLVGKGDYTGVAVTAALYAGESGYSRRSSSSRSRRYEALDRRQSSGVARQTLPFDQNIMHNIPTSESVSEIFSDEEGSKYSSDLSDYQLLQLKNSMDQAVRSGDWNQVVSISSEVESNRVYQARQLDSRVVVPNQSLDAQSNHVAETEESLTTLVKEMNRAIQRSDWSLVGFYADTIREARLGGEASFPVLSTSRALVPMSQDQATNVEMNEATSNKKNTIAKLVKAGKWKGVSIMAGLYQIESSSSLSMDSCC